MTSTIYSASTVRVMVDPSKGSLTNRAECAKEHFKNNLSTNLQLGLAGAAGGLAIAKKPKFLVKIATKIGEVASKLVGKLGAKGMAAKIMKNPTKFGKYGMIAAAALWVLNKIEKHAFKAGQIDQKYTDAAAIEQQTKNVVLDYYVK